MDSKQLALILKIRGIKQKWVADQLGITTATVSYWVTGKRSIPFAHQLTLTKLFI